MADTLSILSGKSEPLPTSRLHKEFEAILSGSDPKKKEKIFSFHDENIITYVELDYAANKLARVIVCLVKDQKKQDSASQVVIGVMMEPSIERFIVTLAVLKSGAAYVALDESFPDERTGHMISSASVLFVITDSDKSFKITPIFVAGMLVEESANLSDRILDENEEITGGKDINSLLAIFFTSGTTGKAKPVTISHRNILSASKYAADRYFQSGNNIMPQFFNFMSIAAPVEFATSLLTFTPLVVIPAAAKSNPGLFIRLVDKYKITAILAVPPTYLKNLLLMLAMPEWSECCSSLKVLGIGSEIVLPKLVSETLKILKGNPTVIQIWGMTETTMMTITEVFENEQDVQQKTWNGKLALGSPCPNNTICILDEHLQILETGGIGQIAIMGENVTGGYFKDSPSTCFDEQLFQGKKVFLTGDYGCFLGNRIYFAGRKQTRIKVKGYQVNTFEVEEVISNIEGVAMAVVFGYIPEGYEDDDVMLVAYYISNDEDNKMEKIIKTKCEASLPCYAVPLLFKIRKMPVRQTTAKIDYPKLNEMFFQYIQAIESQPKPDSFGEKAIIYAVSTVLKIPPITISMDHSYFDLGGDSQKAIYVWSLLQGLGYQGSLSSFLCASSLNDLMNKESKIEIDTSAYLIQQLNEFNTAELEEVKIMFLDSVVNNRDTLLRQTRNLTMGQQEQIVNDHFQYVYNQHGKFKDLSFAVRDKVSMKVLSAVILTQITANDTDARSTYVSDDKQLKAIYTVRKCLASTFDKEHQGATVGYARLFAVSNTISNTEVNHMTFLILERMKQTAKTNYLEYVYGNTMMATVKEILIERGAEIVNSIHLASFKMDGSYPFAHAHADAHSHLFVFRF